jgi:transposase, IS5 family
MRKTYHAQLPLAATNSHARSVELSEMSRALDANLPMLKQVRSDLLGIAKSDARLGREGMSAEQVVRAAIVKQMFGFSYDELSFHLGDSVTLRGFCRFSAGADAPKKTALQRNIAAIRAETWETMNHAVVLHARELKIEDGRWMRTDATVVESNIHHPMDSALLWDSVRVLTRILQRAREKIVIPYCNHKRRAKRRSVAILNARGAEERKALYEDLLETTKATVAVAEEANRVLKRSGGHIFALRLDHYLPLVKKVIHQTEQRVVHAESVPAADKIVSLFEPHTDIIRKDHRATHYGHKVTLSTGRSGLVLDVVVENGNPADSTLAIRSTERHAAIFGHVPERAAFDGGYASKNNLKVIQAAGTREACFSKPAGVPIESMTSTPRIRRVLKNFRAGIEATVSFLKRTFGLSRCSWKGLPHFHAYVRASIVAHNLLTIARRQIAKAKPA